MIAKEIKRISKKIEINSSMYAVGIEAIYIAFKESKSPIDEELTFWTVVYGTFYGLDEADIIELVSDSSLPEFFMLSRKYLGKNKYVKAYFEFYKEYKSAQSKTGIIEDILGKIDSINFAEVIEELPDSVKELLKVK